MCKQPRVCSELGSDPISWSRNAPLSSPSEFESAITILEQVRKLINEDDIESAINLIDNDLEVKIKNWFVIHAQNSGEQRFRILGHKKETKVDFEVDPVRSVSRFVAEVYARDNFRCRYCQNRLLPLNSLKKIESALGKDIFNVTGNTNQLRHGYVYVVRATADHVVPHNRGGRTNLENLVTSCWACNYGKGGYTLEEIGLDDPRKRDVI